jgi:hypothetical protein
LGQPWANFGNGATSSFQPSTNTLTFTSSGGANLTGQEILFSSIGFVPDPGNIYRLKLKVASVTGSSLHRIYLYVGSGANNAQVANLSAIAGQGTQEILLSLTNRDRFRLVGQGGIFAHTATATITLLEVNCLPIFAVAGGNQQPILDFEAVGSGKQVDINWLTNANNLTDHYEVERSTDGFHFESLLQLWSINPAQADELFYETDFSPLPGSNHYRLKLVFKDGSVAYSEPREVFFETDPRAFGIFPNPAKDALYVSLHEYAGKSAALQVIDRLGRPLATQVMDELPVSPVLVPLENLPEGWYTLLVQVAGERARSLPFVVGK